MKLTTNITLTNLIIGDKYKITVDTYSNSVSSVEPKESEFYAFANTQNISLIVNNSSNQDIVVLLIQSYNVSKNIWNTEQVLLKCSEFDLCPTRTPTPTPFLTSTPTKTPTPTVTQTPTITTSITQSSTTTPTPTVTVTTSITQTLTCTPTTTVTTSQTPTNTSTNTPTPTITTSITTTPLISPTSTPTQQTPTPTPTLNCVCPENKWDPTGCVNVVTCGPNGNISVLVPKELTVKSYPAGLPPLLVPALFDTPTGQTAASKGYNYYWSVVTTGPGTCVNAFIAVSPIGQTPSYNQFVGWRGIYWVGEVKIRYRREYNDYVWDENSKYTYDDEAADVDLISNNTCRKAGPVAGCTSCVNSPSVDYTTLPNYPNYRSGCTGRPIDIDIDACNGATKPDTFSKSNFVLYYTGGAGSPFLVIDNIAYDTRGAGLIKVFTAGTPNEMRTMICNRLRFATLVDPNKLNTDLNAALNSNWPYNDLYWYSQCANLPTEVPINLIPC